MKPKVYIVQIPARLSMGVWVPKMDLTPAMVFGELEVMLPSGLNFSDVSAYNTVLNEKLKTFSASKDFLLPLGDPIATAIAVGIIARKNKFATLLKWDRRSSQYFPFKVSFTEEERKINAA